MLAELLELESPASTCQGVLLRPVQDALLACVLHTLLVVLLHTLLVVVRKLNLKRHDTCMRFQRAVLVKHGFLGVRLDGLGQTGEFKAMKQYIQEIVNYIARYNAVNFGVTVVD